MQSKERAGWPPEMKIATVAPENLKTPHPKHFTEKPILLNFYNLSAAPSIIFTFANRSLPLEYFIQNLARREQISLKIPLNKDWNLFFIECFSKHTLVPNEKQRLVHWWQCDSKAHWSWCRWEGKYLIEVESFKQK